MIVPANRHQRRKLAKNKKASSAYRSSLEAAFKAKGAPDNVAQGAADLILCKGLNSLKSRVNPEDAHKYVKSRQRRYKAKRALYTVIRLIVELVSLPKVIAIAAWRVLRPEYRFAKTQWTPEELEKITKNMTGRKPKEFNLLVRKPL
jgi:hypothetical protein